MFRSLQHGGWSALRARVLAGAMVCAVAAAVSAGAQTAAPSGSTVPAQSTPEANAAPAPTPSAGRETVAAKAMPSMMPKVPGTQLDRVVAIVNDDLVLDSDVNEELRLQAFDPYHSASEKLSESRAIERLINRALIMQQLKLMPVDEPTDEDVKKQIEQLRRDIPACAQYHCTTKEGWDRFLAANGFTEQSFFNRWKGRMTVLSFIDQRFEMGVTITPAQIRAYYEKTLVPEYQRQHAPAPKLESISSRIREVLVQQQITNLLGDWLNSLRAQGSVVVLHPGEEAP